MKLSDYLESEGISAAELSRRLGISKAAISKWDEIPEKWFTVLSITDESLKDFSIKRALSPKDDPPVENKVNIGVDKDKVIHRKSKHGLPYSVKGNKVTWLGSEFGHGSEWDENYSADKILHIRKLLQNTGSIEGVFDFCGGMFEKSLIIDVSKNNVLPRIPGFTGFR